MTEWNDPRYPRNLTEHDVETLRGILREHHACAFTPEEKQMLKDMAMGGSIMKRTLIYIVAALALLAIVSDSALRKLAGLIGLMK